jgi:hypothetical protein
MVRWSAALGLGWSRTRKHNGTNSGGHACRDRDPAGQASHTGLSAKPKSCELRSESGTRGARAPCASRARALRRRLRCRSRFGAVDQPPDGIPGAMGEVAEPLYERQVAVVDRVDGAGQGDPTAHVMKMSGQAADELRARPAV